MKLYRYSLNAAASLAGLAAMSGAAHADTVDYGALEELFNEPVTTSATGAPQRATEAPVNMVIITQDEIRSSGAIDIPGVLERYAQVDVERNSSGDAEVSIRGYNQGYAPRLLVLVNGRQVYLDHYGMTNWNLIPVQMSEIRQIEVVAGPNTALFGFNAVAGVVNIITYDPLEDDHNAASVAVGQDGYRNGSFSVTHRINDDLSFRISGGATDGDGWDSEDEVAATGGPAPVPTTGLDVQSLNAHLGARFSPRVRGDVELSVAQNNRLEVLPDNSLASGEYETMGAKGDLSVETDIGLLEGQAYFNTMDVSSQTAGSVSNYTNRVFVANGSWLARLSPDHTLRLAAEYRHNWLALDGNAQLSTDIFSVSGMWNWAIRDDLSATTAVRLDHLQLDRDGNASDSSTIVGSYDTDMDEPSVNFGLVWRATDVDSLRFSAARGVQSPSMLGYGLENSGSSGGATFAYTGNPDIKPTIVENIELGWDHNIAMIDGRFRASIYWQSNENLMFQTAGFEAFSMTSFHGFSGNIGSSELTGVDLSLEGSLHALDWRLSYSHREITDDLSSPTPLMMPVSAYGIDYASTTPANIATASVNWTHNQFELGGDVRYVSETDKISDNFMIAPLRHQIDAYALFNARAAWHATDWLTVAASGRNVFDDDTETTAYMPTPRAFYLTLSSTF